VSSEAAIETIPSKTLKEALTLGMLKELGLEQAPEAPSTRAARPGLRTRGHAKPAKGASVITVNGKRIAIQGKSVTGSAVIKAFGAVIDHYLHDSDLLFLLTSGGANSDLISKVMVQVPHAVQARQEAFMESRLDALVDIYLPSDPLARPSPEIERDNAEAQARFIATVECHSAEDLARLAGHEASNRSATANRWKRQEAIFGVRRLGRDRYPAFQFQDGRPRKAIGKVLKALPRDMSPWQIAFWFSSPNGWLGGAKPMDRLVDEDAIVAAAGHESDDFVG
jgi:hypothetical protein